MRFPSFRHGTLPAVAIAVGAMVLITGAGLASADPAFTDAHAVNGLATLNADGTATIDDMSCSSNGNCGAIGTYLDSSRLTQGFVVNETSGVWGTAQPIPGLSGLNAGGAVGDLLFISCPASGDCGAGGYYTDASVNHQVFLVDETNGSWGTAIELPRSGSLPINLPADLASIACPSAGNCVAGGFYLDGTQQHTQSWVASEASGSWSGAVELAGTGTLNQGILGTLVSIACPASGSCNAVGVYTDASNRAQVYVDSQVAGTWGSAATLPGLVALNSGGSALPSSIACSSVGRCAIAGGYTLTGGAVEAFVADEVGGVWASAQEIPGSAALNTGGDAVVASLACPGDGSCEAVGYYSDTTKTSQVLVASESGGVWGSAAEMPGSAQLNAGNFATAGSVSCVGVGDCRAVGEYTDSSNNSQAFVSTETGGAWSGTAEAAGSAALNTQGLAGLNVVSCTADGACSAGGQYKDSSGSTQAMILDASSAPASKPGPPVARGTSHSKGKVTVTVHDASNGGSPITSYQYSLNGGAWRTGSTGSGSFVVSHLKSKSKVHLRVRAVNEVGVSGSSASFTVKVR